MKTLFKAIAILLLSTFIFTGCGTAPIYNTTNKIENPKSANSTYSAIKSAGTSLGWKIHKIKPGLAQGKLYLRKHIAIINIHYSAHSYKINYVKSTNLKYDATKQVIHKNYNGWIQNLEKAINIRL